MPPPAPAPAALLPRFPDRLAAAAAAAWTARGERMERRDGDDDEDGDEDDDEEGGIAGAVVHGLFGVAGEAGEADEDAGPHGLRGGVSCTGRCCCGVRWGVVCCCGVRCGVVRCGRVGVRAGESDWCFVVKCAATGCSGKPLWSK